MKGGEGEGKKAQLSQSSEPHYGAPGKQLNEEIVFLLDLHNQNLEHVSKEHIS